MNRSPKSMLKHFAVPLFFVLLISEAIANPLVTVIGTNMSAPWLIYGDKGEIQGITVDYLRLMERKMDFKVDIQLLPKNRIRKGFEKGTIDFNCFTSPKWAGKESENFIWSDPLFSVKSVIVTNKSPKVTMQSLEGQRIGTVRRYFYPQLKEYFSSGKMIRDDASDELTNLTKLEINRYNYAVAEINHFMYYLAQNPKSKLKLTGISLDQADVRCWVRKGSLLKMEKLNNIIMEIKSDASLKAVFQKYLEPKKNYKISEFIENDTDLARVAFIYDFNPQ